VNRTVFRTERAIHFSTTTNPFSCSEVEAILAITEVIVESVTMDNFKNIQEEDVHKEARDKHEKPEKQVINELLLIQAEQTANVVLIRESVCKEEINRKHESRTLFGGEVDECENNILKA